ncbi:unnamed protein product [Cuscuta epithymum]|uniref:Uncharacterized protein n=1 Tax=Cuscuta epithymum TaxID=186058 RepID=A0AAV0G110_9ASTE|nr:unnamed protein product [Cuscuta epithymum]
MKFTSRPAAGSEDNPRKFSCSGNNAGFGENAQGKAHFKKQDDLIGVVVFMDQDEDTSKTTTICCLIRGTTTRGKGGSKMAVALQRCVSKHHEETSKTTTMCCLIRGTTSKGPSRGKGGSKMAVALQKCPPKNHQKLGARATGYKPNCGFR